MRLRILAINGALKYMKKDIEYNQSIDSIYHIEDTYSFECEKRNGIVLPDLYS